MYYKHWRAVFVRVIVAQLFVHIVEKKKNELRHRAGNGDFSRFYDRVYFRGHTSLSPSTPSKSDFVSTRLDTSFDTRFDTSSYQCLYANNTERRIIIQRRSRYYFTRYLYRPPCTYDDRDGEESGDCARDVKSNGTFSFFLRVHAIIYN